MMVQVRQETFFWKAFTWTIIIIFLIGLRKICLLTVTDQMKSDLQLHHYIFLPFSKWNIWAIIFNLYIPQYQLRLPNIKENWVVHWKLRDTRLNITSTDFILECIKWVINSNVIHIDVKQIFFIQSINITEIYVFSRHQLDH